MFSFLRSCIFSVLFVAASHLASLSISYAQNVRFSALTLAEGLSQNTITALIQDKQDFLWIGTPEGLHRYNGYSFVDYKHLPNDSLC